MRNRTLLAIVGWLAMVVQIGLGQSSSRRPVVRPRPTPTAGTANRTEAISAFPVNGNANYHLERKPSRSVTIEYGLDISAPSLVAKEWIVVAPKPPELAGQAEIDLTMSPTPRTVVETSSLRREMWVARVSVRTSAQKTSLPVRITGKATLFSRQLQRGASTVAVAALPGAERTASLKANDKFNFNQREFHDWLAKNDLRPKTGEGEIDFARRVFLTIVKGFTYSYSAEMKRTATHVCAAGQSDCGGLSLLFVSALRAQGIPARLLVGRWAESSKEGDSVSGVPYHQQHAKAEFFAQGVGWIPADLSSAVLHDRSPDRLAFFGMDRGDFVTFHLDNDLVVDTIHFGRQNVEFLQGATFWVTGTGNLDGLKQTDHWVVQRN